MDNTNYYDFMTVSDLRDIISELPDDMKIVIPVIHEDDENRILGFRKVRTAGILHCEWEQESEVLCINSARGDKDLADQVHFSGRDVDVVNVLYGKMDVTVND